MLPSCCPPKLYQSGFGLDSKLFSPNYLGYCPVISHYGGMTVYDSAGCYKAMTAVPCKHLVYLHSLYSGARGTTSSASAFCHQCICLLLFGHFSSPTVKDFLAKNAISTATTH